MQATSPMPEPVAHAVEHYSATSHTVARAMTLRSGRVHTTHEPLRPGVWTGSMQAIFDDLWLRRATPPEHSAPPVTVADLFSGCGGLSVGAQEAARATGKRAVHVLGVDNNEAAMRVFADNFPEADVHLGGIEALVDGDVGDSPTRRERRLAERFAGLDLAAGGPPCQGHSDLNNHTRREDPRNQLYLRMARFVEVVRPRLVLIENVPGVAHDRSGVVAEARRVLENSGYLVSDGLVRADALGAAQSRKRHLLLASLDDTVVPSVGTIEQEFGSPARGVLEVINDLDLEPSLGSFGTAANHSQTNRRRIDFLFDHDLYDLPDTERPDCHRLKPHTYRAVYGRMHADLPAPTITSGFGSTGQGRFVHPAHRRTLTPHEAARVQGFPDWFTFRAATRRGQLQEMIGNAVPSKLAYAAVASLLR